MVPIRLRGAPDLVPEAEGRIAARRVEIGGDLPDERGRDLLLPDFLLKEHQGDCMIPTGGIS